MHRAKRTLLLATSIVALLVTTGQAQQRGRGAPGAPAVAGGRGGAPAAPPLMQVRPKSVIANAKPVVKPVEASKWNAPGFRSA